MTRDFTFTRDEERLCRLKQTMMPLTHTSVSESQKRRTKQPIRHRIQNE